MAPRTSIADLEESDSTELPASKLAKARATAIEAMRRVEELRDATEQRFSLIQHQIGAVQNQLTSLARLEENLHKLLSAEDRRSAREQLAEQHTRDMNMYVRWFVPVLLTLFSSAVAVVVWLLGKLPR